MLSQGLIDQDVLNIALLGVDLEVVLAQVSVGSEELLLNLLNLLGHLRGLQSVASDRRTVLGLSLSLVLADFLASIVAFLVHRGGFRSNGLCLLKPGQVSELTSRSVVLYLRFLGGTLARLSRRLVTVRVWSGLDRNRSIRSVVWGSKSWHIGSKVGLVAGSLGYIGALVSRRRIGDAPMVTYALTNGNRPCTYEVILVFVRLVVALSKVRRILAVLLLTLLLAILVSGTLRVGRLRPVLRVLVVVFGNLLVHAVSGHASRSGQSAALAEPVLSHVDARLQTTSLIHHLLDLVANDVPHLLLLLVDLHLDLSPQLLLLHSIQVADDFKPRLQDDGGYKASESTDHVNNTTAHKVHESELLEPSASPDPRGSHWIDNSGNVEAVDDMSAQVSSFRHRRVLHLDADQAKAKGDDPPGVVNRLEVLAVCFAISNNTSLSLGGDTESDKVEDEVGYTHVDGVPV